MRRSKSIHWVGAIIHSACFSRFILRHPAIHGQRGPPVDNKTSHTRRHSVPQHWINRINLGAMNDGPYTMGGLSEASSSAITPYSIFNIHQAVPPTTTKNVCEAPQALISQGAHQSRRSSVNRHYTD
ncbi:MAG TPA: hypothetical protein VH593_12010 [Ktedonobacteraceae bacterium]